MTLRTVKIIKPHQAEINATVPIQQVHEMGEAEIQEKRVLVVKNWIEERRDSDTAERSGMRREIIEWRKFNVPLPIKKIAIRASTK